MNLLSSRCGVGLVEASRSLPRGKRAGDRSIRSIADIIRTAFVPGGKGSAQAAEASDGSRPLQYRANMVPVNMHKNV